MSFFKMKEVKCLNMTYFVKIISQSVLLNSEKAETSDFP